MRINYAYRVLVSVCLLGAGQQAFSQDKEEVEYRKQAESMRQAVWSWNKSEFKNTVVPEEYAKASRVVIAHHTELTADSKSMFAGFSSSKKLSITEIVRERIKLNDKASVDDYSELNFTKFVKRRGLLGNAKATTFVGVRVVKPNQSVKEINADDIVLTQDELKDKKAKIAIPDLQPGDIIDIFIATDQELQNDFSAKSYNVVLFDDAPVVHYSFHGQLGKKYTIEYRSYNGAPQLKVSKNSDDDIIIDVEKKNMAAFETSLWVAPALQLPLIRMNIALGGKGLASRMMGATSKPGEVTMNKSYDDVVANEQSFLAAQFFNTYIRLGKGNEYFQIVSEAKKLAKQAGLSLTDMSDEEKAAFLYYSFRFTKMLAFDIDKLQRSITSGNYTYDGLAFILACTMKAADLEPAILVTTPRTGFRMTEILDMDDLTNATYLMGANKFLSIESIFDVPFVAPESIEGNKTSSSIKLQPIRGMYSEKRIAEVGPGIKVPESIAAKNGHIEQLKIALNANQSNLAVQRRSIIKGHNKFDVQRQLILYEDYYEAERKAMGEDKSLLETLDDGKKSRKYVDEVRNAFAEARKNNKDAFIAEAKDWFEQDITDIKDFKVENMGVRHTAPDLIYSSNFNLEGLVKKAGNNIILEIGKIQGQPLSIKQDQRKRTVDIYMSYARSIEYQVELKIPDGFTAEGVDALNKNVSNETGLFIVEATSSGQSVNIKIRKQYLHGFEPVANWDKLVQFIDASNEWTNAKLLFKKK